MAADFDAYHIWLGIPPEEQPPHYYRLLGVTLFESNLAVIEAAADRQMTFLRQQGQGPHSEASQKLLNHVSKALVELLSPAKKAAYDDRLRAEIEAAAAPPPEEESPPIEFAAWEAEVEQDARSVSVVEQVNVRRRPMSTGLKVAMAGFAAVVLGAGLGTYPLWGSSEPLDGGSVQLQVTARQGTSILLDSKDIESDRLAGPIPLSAGRHTVDLSRQGTIVATARFWVVPGRATPVTLTEPEPPKAVASTNEPPVGGQSPGESNAPGTGSGTRSETGKRPTEVASADRTNSTTASATPPADLPKDTFGAKVELAGSGDPASKPNDSKPMPSESSSEKPARPQGDVVRLDERKRLKGSQPVHNIAFSDDATWMASYHFASNRGEVRVWNLGNSGTGKAEKNVLSLTTTTSFNPRIRFGSNNQIFYVAGNQGQPTNLATWNWKTNRTIAAGTLGTPNGSRPARVTAWELSDDEQMAVFAVRQHNDNAQRQVGFLYWNPKTKKEIRFAPEPGADFIDHLAMTADGSIAAAAFHNSPNSRKDQEDSVRVWETKSKEILFREKFDTPMIRCEGLRFIDEGRKLIIMGPGLTEFRVLDVATGMKKEYTVSLFGGDSANAQFFPKTLIGITKLRGNRTSSEMFVFGLEEGKILSYPVGNESGVESLQLSPDGKLLATGDDRGEIILWDVERK